MITNRSCDEFGVCFRIALTAALLLGECATEIQNKKSAAFCRCNSLFSGFMYVGVIGNGLICPWLLNGCRYSGISNP